MNQNISWIDISQAIGAFVLLASLQVLACYHLRRRRRASNSQNSNVTFGTSACFQWIYGIIIFLLFGTIVLVCFQREFYAGRIAFHVGTVGMLFSAALFEVSYGIIILISSDFTDRRTRF